MTREEAIEVLKANYPSKCFEQLREAVDMAIKALEAQDRKVDVEQATANFAKKLEEGYFKSRRKCLADYLSDDPSLLRKVGAEELGIESPSKRSEQTGEKIAGFVETLFADVDVRENGTSGSSTDSSTDDCISRSEAIRIASGYCHWSRIPEELAKLPSVKPKERTGEWQQGEIDWLKLGECFEDCRRAAESLQRIR